MNTNIKHFCCFAINHSLRQWMSTAARQATGFRNPIGIKMISQPQSYSTELVGRITKGLLCLNIFKAF